MAFTKGCPFCCPWCCNPENLSFEPEVCWHERLCLGCSVRADGRRDANGAPCDTSPERCPAAAKELLGQWRAVDELAAELLRDLPFYEESGGGVTVSGGECLAGATRQRAVLALLELCHAGGASTALETTLAVPLAVPLDRLVGACDAFLVDFKIADRARSLAVTGIDPLVRDANVARVVAAGGRVVARMPVIPGFTDGDACIRANARRARELGIRRADVLPFHQLGESKYASVGRAYGMGGVAQLSEEDVERALELVRAEGLLATLRGE
ncbi:glycyl-radical enzyme activating protein [Parolsenella catena]|uniref:glycyl-radical enzyme activating protein n=1 Tax=Parolsenella catena TaxID=2003188 RepID=UPI00307793F9